jgi:hypothetical protein
MAGSNLRAVLGFALAALFCLLISSPASVLAKTCKDDSIASVSNDGDIVKMLSGAVFEIDAADQVDTALWLAADDVLICAESLDYKGKIVKLYTIINTDENGEKVDADRLR